MKGKHLKNKQTFFSEWSLYKLFIFLCLMCFKRGNPRRGLRSAQWLQPPNVQFCCIVLRIICLRFCFLAVHPQSSWKLSSATFILGKCIYQKDTGLYVSSRSQQTSFTFLIEMLDLVHCADFIQFFIWSVISSQFLELLKFCMLLFIRNLGNWWALQPLWQFQDNWSIKQTCFNMRTRPFF